MSEKHVAARKKYWASVSPEKRSERMSAVAKVRQVGMSPAQKHKHAMDMVEAKRAKKIVV
jgi:hypothetical protein